jgi:ESX secretion-associated protein EspA/E
MSIFASAARCIASLANLGAQGAGVGLDVSGWSSDPSAEGIAAMSTSAAGDLGSLGGFVGGRVANGYVKSLSESAQRQLFSQMGGSKGVKEFAKGVSIISWTITTVQLLQLTTGFGSPYEGDSLKAGSQQFTTLAEQLKSALPDTGWQGDASEAYADLDTALRTVSQTMADLDSQLAALVKDQADWVTHMQLAFGILNALLSAALIIEMIITFTVPAPAGPIAAKVFAITVAALGISAAVSFLGTLLGYSIENGKKADALAANYSELVAGITQHGAFAQTKVAAAGESTVSSFEAISAGMSGASAVADARTVAPPPSPAKERATQDAEPSAAGSGGPAAPAAPQAPDYASSSTPTGTMPTLVGAAAMSGQAANLSSRVSQPEALMNQARTQLRQAAQTVSEEREAEVPAEEAARAGEVDGAGAATQGTERAPIAVAPVGEQGHQSTPIARSA